MGLFNYLFGSKKNTGNVVLDRSEKDVRAIEARLRAIDGCPDEPGIVVRFIYPEEIRYVHEVNRKRANPIRLNQSDFLIRLGIVDSKRNNGCA